MLISDVFRSGPINESSIYFRKNLFRLAVSEPGGFVVKRVETATRKVPLSYGGHVRGWHPVRAGHGSVVFESLIERNVITALASFSELLRVTTQPLTVFYELRGIGYRYTPDILVTLSKVPFDLERLGFRERTLIECKPQRLLEAQRIQIERNFWAIQAAISTPIVLITDQDLMAGLLGDRHG